MLLQKADSNSCLDSQTYDGGTRLPLQCCLLALANQHSAKSGRIIEV